MLNSFTKQVPASINSGPYSRFGKSNQSSIRSSKKDLHSYLNKKDASKSSLVMKNSDSKRNFKVKCLKIDLYKQAEVFLEEK